LFKINEYGEVIEISDIKYTIGNILSTLVPDMDFDEISDVKTISDTDTLKIHDF
jgi:hypothetical protein